MMHNPSNANIGRVLGERIFEIFISHLPGVAAGAVVVFIFSFFVLAGRVWLGGGQ